MHFIRNFIEIPHNYSVLILANRKCNMAVGRYRPLLPIIIIIGHYWRRSDESYVNILSSRFSEATVIDCSKLYVLDSDSRCFMLLT